jgi:LysR family glycine cleavage system transcriptional activator
VNIRATLARTDFAGDGIDMAVRAGAGTWEGLTSIKLQDEQLVPVCSPAFREGRLPRVPADLLKVPLLHDERQPWSIWFEAIGLEYRDVGGGTRYTDQNLLIPAAVAGLGVALARSSLVQADLETGRLVRLFSRSVPARSSYFIVYPKGSQGRRKVQVFQQWLLEQFERLSERASLARGWGKL